MALDTRNLSQIDFTAVKAHQKATWASGNYAVIGTSLQLVGETLCEAVDLRAGERVLDVACGNRNSALAAARRFAHVTGTDYVPRLLGKAAEPAQAEGLEIDFREADAEALPFSDGTFDVVLSTFGVVFAPNQAAAARPPVARAVGELEHVAELFDDSLTSLEVMRREFNFRYESPAHFIGTFRSTQRSDP